jgi:hypothetical protein
MEMPITVTLSNKMSARVKRVLEFGPFDFRDLSVAGGMQANEVIIGRDILNQFIVTLNGLASVVEISQ